MAERPLDRLAPQAMALIFGVAALAAGLGGIAADITTGRPSASSGVGFVLMLPVAVLAAVVGFAIGYGAGAWAKRHGVNRLVPMKPYRIVMAFVLGVVTMIGATLGARPVLRHERLYQPRVISGAGVMLQEPGMPVSCLPARAVTVCSPSNRGSQTAFLTQSGEISVRCERDGQIRMTRPSGDVAASLDLSNYDQARDAVAVDVRLADGREAIGLLAAVRGGTRHLFTVFNQDGQPLYQELIEGATRGSAVPLLACASDEGGSFVVDLNGAPVTYRPR